MAPRPVASTVSNAVELGLNPPTGVDRRSVCRRPSCLATLWLHDARMGTGIQTVVGRWISECPDCRPTTLLRPHVYGGSVDRRFAVSPARVRSAASRVLNARVNREVDVSVGEQSGVRQSLAGMVVAEKNRCVRISAPSACAATFRGGFSELAGTISGTIRPRAVFP